MVSYHQRFSGRGLVRVRLDFSRRSLGCPDGAISSSDSGRKAVPRSRPRGDGEGGEPESGEVVSDGAMVYLSASNTKLCGRSAARICSHSAPAAGEGDDDALNLCVARFGSDGRPRWRSEKLVTPEIWHPC